MNRTRSISLAALAATALAAAPVAAGAGIDAIPLPNGYQPEGIASGPGDDLYVGSIPTGRVVRLDARTGSRTEVVPAREGRSALGLKVDRGRVFVAGGPTGRAFVYDARTGADLADVVLTAGPSLVNDVDVTRTAAFFTDSLRPQLYRLALDAAGAPAARAQTLPITGDMRYDDNPQTFEANGIVSTRSGEDLLVVQSRTGKLFRIDPVTGHSVEVVLTGGDGRGLVNGDGLVLQGETLYAVQNRLNRIAVVDLDSNLDRGRITTYLEDPNLDFPSTIARQGGDLFTVNARFSTPPRPDTPYDVRRVEPKPAASAVAAHPR